MKRISPLAKIATCLAGIAAAGVPLVFFTAPQAQVEQAALPSAPAAAELEEVPLLVRYARPPQELCILHEGRELCRLSPEGTAGRWRGGVLLPRAAQGLELEVVLTWAEPSETPQALTLELAPPGRPVASDTQWAAPGEKVWHTIFSFKW